MPFCAGSRRARATGSSRSPRAAARLPGLVAQGHGARRDRDRGARSSRCRALPDLRRAAHRPLLEGQAREVCPPARRGNGEATRRRPAESFHRSHVDGSNLTLQENLDTSAKPLQRLAKNDLVLEIETGAVGGEEDDVVGDKSAKLYTTPEDTLEVARRLNPIGGRYLLAATFGNVHGVYKPGHVKLKPGVLKECQDAVVKAHGEGARFYLVFHGGSGSALSEIHEALDYGVVKMNVDTDMQYAFTRAVAGHMFKNYAGVLKVDGEVGNKKVYDPRSYLAVAEAAMADRVKQAVSDLRGGGMTMLSS